MKKIKMIEKIVLMLVVVAIICGISTVNHATGDVSDLFSNPDTIPVKPDTNQGDTANQGTQQPTTPNNNNNNNNNSASLPKTGANDTAIWVLAGACAVIAIFTFKKVRDYNV